MCWGLKIDSLTKTNARTASLRYIMTSIANASGQGLRKNITFNQMFNVQTDPVAQSWPEDSSMMEVSEPSVHVRVICGTDGTVAVDCTEN